MQGWATYCESLLSDVFEKFFSSGSHVNLFISPYSAPDDVAINKLSSRPDANVFTSPSSVGDGDDEINPFSRESEDAVISYKRAVLDAEKLRAVRLLVDVNIHAAGLVMVDMRCIKNGCYCGIMISNKYR